MSKDSYITLVLFSLGCISLEIFSLGYKKRGVFSLGLEKRIRTAELSGESFGRYKNSWVLCQCRLVAEGGVEGWWWCHPD